MAAFQELTRGFWSIAVPQIAAAEMSVKHMVVVLASRQEKNSTNPSLSLQRLHQLEREHYTTTLSCLTRGATIRDEEVLLVASVLFIAHGNFEALENQTAQELFHFSSGLKILIARAKQPYARKWSETITKWVQPMLVRLELMYSIFMTPADASRYEVLEEPDEPVLPQEFMSIDQARQTFLQICCYRYHHSFRYQVWDFQSPGFQIVRRHMLEWHRLIVAYMSSLGTGSEAETQRSTIMISQFHLLFVALIYSARTDLHSFEDHVAPAWISLDGHRRTSLTYELPERYIQLLPGLDWETQQYTDPLQVRLWPLSKVTNIQETSATMSLTFCV
jgi:hypothetical protein